MKMAFVTTFDARDITVWSGTLHYMARAFEAGAEAGQFHALGNIRRHLSPACKLQQFMRKLAGLGKSPDFYQKVAKSQSAVLAKRLCEIEAEVVLAPFVNPAAFLETEHPVVLWMDGVYAAMLECYPQTRSLSPAIIRENNAITKASLDRATLAIFSSEWAARTATEFYGTPAEKIRVVPYGANLESGLAADAVDEVIDQRPGDCVRLIFIGKDWRRKGGEKALAVARLLHEGGTAVELHVAGCDLPQSVCDLPYVRCHGFISKFSPEGLEQIGRLLRSSHFMLMPSEAEAYGIVFCEANAFAVPALSTRVGGIPTVIQDGRNGMTFDLEAGPEVYAAYIADLMRDRTRYAELARGAFREYETRLNWQAATRTVCRLIRETI